MLIYTNKEDQLFIDFLDLVLLWERGERPDKKVTGALVMETHTHTRM